MKLAAKIRILAIAAPCAILLAACATAEKSEDKKAQNKPCPRINVLADSARLVKLTQAQELDFQAEILSAQGECVYKANSVDMTLTVAIEAKRGAANLSHKADLSYYVAIPAFFPKPEGKAVFPVSIPFAKEKEVESARYKDDPITLTIPLSGGAEAQAPEIYVGLQLDAQQLRYNRSSGAPATPPSLFKK